MESSDLKNTSLLIVEDEALIRRRLSAGLERLGVDVTQAKSLDQARRFLKELTFDFALIDVNLPDGKGTQLLKEAVIPKETGAIVMTAYGGVTGAVEAMRLGASDYLVKPFDPMELPLVLRRARQAKQSARLTERRREETESFFFGASLAELRRQIEKIVEVDGRLKHRLPPVLIQGETGSGKTTIARWLHNHGPRSERPLVEVNCSTLPETLAESELFGHEKGAFTDARSARMGLFEAADGGTLFLDELPSLALALQAKVLTVIEDGRVRRVGSTRDRVVDVRILAATSRDLKEMAQSGRFREDLYHRLDLFRLRIPPLREQGPDLPELADFCLAKLCQKHRIRSKRISEIGQQRMLAYPWPGNVRELEHELERAVVFEDSGPLELSQMAGLSRSDDSSGGPGEGWFNPGFTFPESGFSLDEAIEQLIRRALHQSSDNVSAAARLLGVTRDYLRYRLAGRREDKAQARSHHPSGGG